MSPLTGTAPVALVGVFASVLVLLAFKAQVLAAATAATRGRLGKFINEEDAGERCLRRSRNRLLRRLPAGALGPHLRLPAAAAAVAP